MFNAIMKKTFYGQFAAGTSIKASEEAVSRLKNTGIRSMMMVPIESVEYKTETEEYVIFLRINSRGGVGVGGCYSPPFLTGLLAVVDSIKPLNITILKSLDPKISRSYNERSPKYLLIS